MTCTNCNAQLSEGAKFCNKCGTTQETKSAAHSYQQLNDKHKKMLPYALAGIGVVIVLVIVIAALSGGGGNRNLVGEWACEHGEEIIALMRNGTGRIIETDRLGIEHIDEITWRTQRHRGMRLLIIEMDVSTNNFPYDFQTINFEYEVTIRRGETQLRIRPLGENRWYRYTRVD